MPAMKRHINGYTLIELAIAIVIIGIILVPFSPLYTLYKKNIALETTKTNVAAVANALGNFRSLYGRYPCPASLSLTRSSPDYGREINDGDCQDSTILDGTFVKTSLGTIDFDPTAGVSLQTQPIRIGAVPFRQLNLEENDAYDAYGNRILYIVTQRLAEDSTFDPANGGISLLNDAGDSAVTPPDSVHFIVLSTGPDGLGAFTQSGLHEICPTGQLQSNNCNAAGPPVYRIAQRSDSDTPARFDDIVNYFAQDDMPIWQYSSAPGASLDIHQKSLPGNVGVRTGPTYPLAFTTDIGGNLRSNAELKTQRFCEVSGTNDCFPSSLIGGEEATGGGMKCPDDDVIGTTGKFMVAISDGAPVCADYVELRCPAGSFMVGFNPDGTLNCNNPPDPCPATPVSLCGTNLTLPVGANGSTQILTAGTSFSRTYLCDNGTWQPQASTGMCTCTPTTQTNAPGCASGFTGTLQVQRTLTCPAGTWSGWVTIVDTCTCSPTTETRTQSCPANQTGSITEQRNNTCPSGAWGPWTQTANTCTCAPKTETRTLSCPSGLSGSIKESRNLSCPAGTWSGWTETSNTCTCVAKSESRPAACPDGFTGSRTETRNLQCPAATWTAWAETANSCKPAPVVTCKLKSNGAGVKQSIGIGKEKGDVCTCGSAPTSCYTKLGTGSYDNYTGCTCE